MSNSDLQDVLSQIYELEAIGKSEDLAILSALKDKYNTLVAQQAERLLRPARDMMDVLPDSIWIEIIHLALPRTGYVTALLTLTMVSERWLVELTSVPILWSRIEFLSTLGDFESSLETCVHLSRQCTIDLVLYVPFPEDSVTLITLVDKIRTRLRSVSWTNDPHMPPAGHQTNHSDIIYSISQKTFHLFEKAPGIDTLAMYITPTHTWLNNPLAGIISDANAPPNLQNLMGWSFGEEDFQKSPLLMQQLRNLECYLLLSRLSMVLATEARPRKLTISYWGTRDPLTLLKDEEALTFHPLERWTKITSFMYYAHFRDHTLQFLAIISPTVSDLSLTIPNSKVERFLLLLGDFHRLKKLSIDFSGWSVGDRGTNITNYPTIPEKGPDISLLTQLKLHFGTLRRGVDPSDDSVAVQAIFGYFARTYLHVRSAAVYLGQECLFRPLCDYIAALANLIDLTIFDRRPGVWDRPNSARIIKAGDLPCLRAPNLYALSLYWQNRIGEEGMLAGVDTKCLTIISYGDEDQIKLPHGPFPSLVELRVQMQAPRNIFKESVELVSFPELTTFNLSAPTRGHRLATQLCLQLLSQPDICPRLSELSFVDARPEWDILFMMLETRNFLPGSGISRIRTLTLPGMPEWMRVILVSLLQGHFIQRPSSEELSFKGVQNLCFDAKITGCYTCLRYMLGPCDQPVSPKKRIFVSHWNEISFDDTILDCSGLVWAEGLPASPWIARRGELLADWTQERKHWSETYSRSWICKKREQDTKVRISEHDRVDYYESVEGL